MDLNELINIKFQELSTNGTFEKIVTVKAEKLIIDLIDDAFSRYGDFSKSIQAAIKEKVKLDLSRTNIDEYNHNINILISRILNESLVKRGLDKCEKAINDMISHEMPSDMKLSELVERFKKEITDDDGEKSGEITFTIEKSYSSTWVYLDEESNESNYNCKYRIAISEKGDIFSATCDSNDFAKKMIIGGLIGFEELLFKIYSSGSKILITEDDTKCISLEYGEGY